MLHRSSFQVQLFIQATFRVLRDNNPVLKTCDSLGTEQPISSPEANSHKAIVLVGVVAKIASVNPADLRPICLCDLETCQCPGIIETLVRLSKGECCPADRAGMTLAAR